MSQWDLSVNFFVALFALIDPIGSVPVFAAATAGAEPAGRRIVAAYLSMFICAFLIFFYFSGIGLLQFFGISLPAFRIAGGVILLLLGLDMMRGEFTARFSKELADTETGAKPTAQIYAKRRFESLVVPFAMPLLIGPGAISTVIIYASEAKDLGWAAIGMNVVAIAVVSLMIFICFWLTPVLSRMLGQIGMTIIVRVLGLILCAMAIQFMLAGLADSTHGLILREAAFPYIKK
jgi:multiple antibiotic resistance protein